MRKKSGQPNEFGVFVAADKAPAPAPAPVEETVVEVAVEELVGDSDGGWSKKGKRKSK
jgi:hypothetical protein